MSTANRFEAEWIAAQHNDEHGEWDPDRDEYVARNCVTLEEAKRVALAQSKAANVVEWVRVTEYAFCPELKIPPHNPAAWDAVRVWHGEWSGEWSEDRT